MKISDGYFSAFFVFNCFPAGLSALGALHPLASKRPWSVRNCAYSKSTGGELVHAGCNILAEGRLT